MKELYWFPDLTNYMSGNFAILQTIVRKVLQEEICSLNQEFVKPSIR